MIAGARAVVWLVATAALCALSLGLRFVAFHPAYFWRNEINEAQRLTVVGAVAFASLLSGVLGVGWLVFRGRTPDGERALERLAVRVAPLAPFAALTCFFDWAMWNAHPLAFLSLVLVSSLALGATVSAALRTAPFDGSPRSLPGVFSSAAVKRALTRPALPLALVTVASLGYVLWFSYFTVVWHRSVRSGYDLAIEDSILWNLLHGRFFHAAPTLGPTGSHFGRHATLVSYLILPFYALHQNAETLLVVQSALIGFAAVPLFLFARGRIGAWPAVFVAVLYLLHPAVQEGNLFEVHYVKFGAIFFWLALWLVDSGRRAWALAAAALTLCVREDVATWVVLLGVFAFFSGRGTRFGIGMTALALLYVVAVKFAIMPQFREGRDDLLFMYQELLPKGRSSFGWVLVSVIGNPAYTVETLLDHDKLLFFLQILVPLSLLPLRRTIGWFALMPGMLYCFLATHYPPLVDIHYQYSPHLLAFLFPALVIVLEAMPKDSSLPGMSRSGAFAALVAATLACSYQFGALFQQHTSRGGPIPYKFGWDPEGLARRRSMDAILAVVPPGARVAASAFTVPQLSARENGYSLSLALYDADWVVAPTAVSEYVGSELDRTRQALTSGGFGVVAVRGAFFAAKKGAVSPETAEMVRRLSSGRR